MEGDGKVDWLILNVAIQVHLSGPYIFLAPKLLIL